MRILLPGLKGAAQITLDVAPRSVSAHVAGRYRLTALPLPYEVDAERFRATFNIDKQALQITLTVVVPPSTSTRHPAQAESTSAAQPGHLAAEFLAAQPGGDGTSRSGSEGGTVAREQDAAATPVAPRAADAAATACGHGGPEAESHSQQAGPQMGAAGKGSAEASRAGASDADSCCDTAQSPAPAKASQSASSAAWSADGQGRQPRQGALAEALSAASNSTASDELDAGPPAQHADRSDGLTENERRWRQLHPLTGLQAQTAAVSAQLDSTDTIDAALVQRAAAGLSMQRASTSFPLLSNVQTSSSSWQSHS